MSYPQKQGLYDPRHEHDACGVGFIVNIRGEKSHSVVERGLEILLNIDHRGAVGADPLVGDGAGILIQIPDTLLRAWADGARIALPQPGDYAVAMCFLPRDAAARDFAATHFERLIRKEGQHLIGWRDVPINPAGMGQTVLDEMPMIRQAIIGRGEGLPDQDAFERKLLAIRKQTQNPLEGMADKHGLPGLREFYMPSCSTRTLVYKGLLLAGHVGSFY
jgi:glutamate synthase (NADPH/NADH) large chain